ncbi:MAG: FecR domain-containing protein [Spirochaetales bacterium]|nr:FecR domain-containing protein [Spirochaetales bacterium]
MKEWIKNLNDEDFEKLLHDTGTMEDVPPDLDNSTLGWIRRQKKIKKGHFFSNRFFHSRSFRFTLAALFCLLILIPSFALIYFLYNRHLSGRTVSAVPYFIINQVSMKDTGELDELSVNNVITPGQTVATGPGSVCRLKIADTSLLEIREESTVEFKVLNKLKTVIELKSGKLFINKEKTAFQVITPDLTASLVGTSISLEYSEGSGTVLSVFEGKVRITPAHKDIAGKEILVKAGNTFTITKDTQHRIEPLPPDTDKDVQESMRPQRLKNPSSLTITGGDGTSQTLIIDNKENYSFTHKISAALTPGEHTIRLEKAGYKPWEKTIDIKQGESMILTLGRDIILEPVRKSLSPSIIYHNKDSEVLGFGVSGAYAVAVFRSSLTGFQNGKQTWNLVYNKENVLFMSLPVITRDKVYITYSHNLLIIDLFTGTEIKRMDLPGTGYIYKAVLYKDKLYIPCSQGIYILDPVTDTLNDRVFSSFIGPREPVFYRDNGYLSSYLSGDIACHTLDGKRTWLCKTENQSFCIPVVMKESIVTGDMSGNLLKISLETGKKELTRKISEAGVISLADCGNGMVCVFSHDSILHFLDIVNFNEKKSIIADAQADTGSSSYPRIKLPLASNTKIYMGTNSGNLLLIDIVHNTRQKIPLSQSGICSSVFPYMDGFITGSMAGEVILLAYKEEK